MLAHIFLQESLDNTIGGGGYDKIKKEYFAPENRGGRGRL